ncbi:hypothetical protein RND71_014215 [Anisodus tanguticus]|uniref:Uncharacterized protein n=1 Tax=Anisodus tanguticus TaxID=243964 RepID=A0AAE1SAT3_9SOLA|nr:hypothetical protein RND71_014215 [Anisodus tanguticus]
MNLEQFEASRLLDGNVPGNAVCSSGAAKSSSLFDLSLSPSHELQQIGVGPGANTLTTTDDNPEINLKRRVKTTIIKKISKKMSREYQAHSEFNLPTDAYCGDESTSKIFSHLEQNQLPEVPETKTSLMDLESSLHSSHDISESTSNACIDHNETGSEFPHAATDAARRERSVRFTVMSRDTALGKGASKIRESHVAVEQEEGYHYIPQLGDEVVYFQQLNLIYTWYFLTWRQEYIEYSNSSEPGPWTKNAAAVQAVEICLVTQLSYATLPGSGMRLQWREIGHTEISVWFGGGMRLSKVVVGEKVRFPVPLSPDIIQLRIENNYCRSLEAMKHGFSVMLANGETLPKNKSFQ